MAPKWLFHPKLPNDTIKNPISGEFFSAEAVQGVAASLIREGIQNSLDARIPDSSGRASGCAKVRIYLSEDAGALPPSKSEAWFNSLWPHIAAPKNGLRNQPSAGDICPFIVYEDFNTTGVTGDALAHEVSDGRPNNFLNFFRAEGHSDKGAHERGSWGVGKIVFNRASRVNSFIAFTVRNDDQKQMVFGRSILKFHKANNVSYKSDGFFGEPLSPSDFMAPCEDANVVRRLRDDFNLKRTTEPGLSIIIPWCEFGVGNDDRFTWSDLVREVVRGFFWPILLSHLEVEIASPTRSITLNQASLDQDFSSIFEESEELRALIELATIGKTMPDSELIELAPPPSDQSQKWNDECVSTDVAERIREGLRQELPLGVRVPMTVYPRTAGTPQPTFFDIYLQKTRGNPGRPVFMRDELIIADADGLRSEGIRALVVISDGPLATLLRDAETPAHTKWNPQTGNFKNKYKFGPGVLKFVRHSVQELIRLVHAADVEPDPDITMDYFSITPPRSTETPDKGRGRGNPPGPEPEPPPGEIKEGPAKRYRVEKAEGGFSVRRGAAGARTPDCIRVDVAYMVRRGNPLKKYSSIDFDFDTGDLSLVSDNNSARIEIKAPNRLYIYPATPEFRVDVSGFDTERDLYLRSTVLDEAEDGDQEN